MISKIALMTVSSLVLVVVGVYLISIITKYLLLKKRSDDNIHFEINQSICFCGLLFSFGIIVSQALGHVSNSAELFVYIVNMPNNTLPLEEIYKNIGAELFATLLYFVFNIFIATVLASFLKKENILATIVSSKASSILFSATSIVVSICFLSLLKNLLNTLDIDIPTVGGSIPNIN